MRPLKRLLAVLLALLVTTPAVAQLPSTALSSRPIVSNHDFDSATATYCVLSNLKKQSVNVSTVGSSATLTAASGTPFSAVADPQRVAPGDEIVVGFGTSPFGKTTRYVLAVTSPTTLTMNVATDFSANGSAGYALEYRTLSCGTTADDGWFAVSMPEVKSIVFQIDQLSVASGSVAVTVQCRTASPWAQAVPVYPPVGGTGQCGTGLFTTAGATARCEVVFAREEGWNTCRVGVALTDDAGDLTTNLEQITATLESR